MGIMPPHILSLTAPLILALLGIVGTLFVERLPGPPVFEINLYIIVLPIQLSDPLLAKIILAFISFGLVTFSFCRNYSSFFPTKLSFTVFYDEDGIEASLDRIGKAASTTVAVVNDWKKARNEYFKKIDETIGRQVQKYSKFFSDDVNGQCLRSEGEATHKVEYVGFWQRYKISVISGKVTHVLEPPECTALELESRYELLETRNNIVEPRFSEFLRLRMVVQPVMKQSLMTHERGLYEARLVGVTRFRFFPFISLERTVFCAETSEGLIPLGYCYYFPIR